MNQHDDRRSRARKPFENVKGLVKPRGLAAFVTRKSEVSFVDYSRDGAAFLSPTDFTPGDDVSLEFRFGAYYVADLIATVRHTKQVEGAGYQIGVRFDYNGS